MLKLRRSDLSTHGMSEFRLVVGFIQLPFPYLGARRMSDILKITESSEMDPWRLGNLLRSAYCETDCRNSGSSQATLWAVQTRISCYFFHAIYPVQQGASAGVL